TNQGAKPPRTNEAALPPQTLAAAQGKRRGTAGCTLRRDVSAAGLSALCTPLPTSSGPRLLPLLRDGISPPGAAGPGTPPALHAPSPAHARRSRPCPRPRLGAVITHLLSVAPSLSDPGCSTLSSPNQSARASLSSCVVTLFSPRSLGHAG
uniref:Uncharacterized protein n=1 Tax=Aegilops tauschii subsp. strangulata TaxID=200361 RepID=A0A453INJ2_AEGTS